MSLVTTAQKRRWTILLSVLPALCVAAVALPILLAILAALYFGIVPGLRLWSADRTMKAGNYSDAFTTLADLGSFPGAESRLAECEWQIAKEHYDTAITADDTTELPLQSKDSAAHAILDKALTLQAK